MSSMYSYPMAIVNVTVHVAVIAVIIVKIPSQPIVNWQQQNMEEENEINCLFSRAKHEWYVGIEQVTMTMQI